MGAGWEAWGAWDGWVVGVAWVRRECAWGWVPAGDAGMTGWVLLGW